MKIGDQLELVAKLKGGKDKKNAKRKSKPSLADLGIEAWYHQYPESDVWWAKNNGQPSLGPSSEIRGRSDEPTASLDPDRGQEIAQLIRKEVNPKQERHHGDP